MKKNSDVREIERLQKRIIKIGSKNCCRLSRKERRLYYEFYFFLERLKKSKPQKKAKVVRTVLKGLKFIATFFGKLAHGMWFNP